MRTFWPRRHVDKPDIEKAKADLERARSRRDEVDALVADLMREKRLNSFTANAIIHFRGGRS